MDELSKHEIKHTVKYVSWAVSKDFGKTGTYPLDLFLYISFVWQFICYIYLFIYLFVKTLK